jgi:hypothetical protein
VLRTLPDGQEPYLLARSSSDHRPDQQDLQQRGHRPFTVIKDPGSPDADQAPI